HIHVPTGVDRVCGTRQPQVLAEEIAIDLLVVLVGVADDEGDRAQRGLTDDEGDHGLELLLPRELGDDLALPGPGLVAEAGCLEVGDEDAVCRARHGVQPLTAQACRTAAGRSPTLPSCLPAPWPGPPLRRG